MLEISQAQLRSWEKEFSIIKPKKNQAGKRIYTEKDIQAVRYIKDLLKERKLTIEGAKKHIIANKHFENNGGDTIKGNKDLVDVLLQIKEKLAAIRSEL